MQYVGKSLPIHDAEEKATGRAIYAGDMNLTNMAHMAIVFSPIPHGKVKSINCEKALNMEGVVDIIHCFNVEHNEYNRYKTQLGQALIQKECIFNEHVRFVGDRVAAVIAETEEIARKAVKLVEVEYEEYEFAITHQEALAGKIDNVYADGAVYDAIPISLGEKTTEDVVTISTTAELARINHICMETHSCVVDYNRYSKQITIYSPNQAVFGIRTVISEMFNLDFNNVRVIKTTMGGSFGAKQEWILEPVVVAAALKVGRPVKLVYNREETIRSTISRAPLSADCSISYTKDGWMKDLSCDVSLNAGAYLGNSFNYITTFGSKLFKAYNFNSVEFTGRAVITNSSVNGAFRGWTSPEATIMLEHNVNMAARALGIDEVDIRVKNAMKPYQEEAKSHVNIGNYRAIEALETGREKFEWDKKKKEIKEFNATSKRYKRGVGVGLGGHLSSFYPVKTDFARVEMRITESGTVRCNVTIHDHGCGTVTAFKMIAAEALGISVDDVKVTEGDSDVTPFDIGCFSSRTTYVIGKTTYECANVLKQRMKSHFAELENVDIENVEFDGKTIFDKTNPELKYSWTKLVEKSQQILKHELFVSHETVTTSNDLVCGAHFAMVEVDTYSGMTKILDYLAMQDVGQAINREMCIAQTQGAVIMGAGGALTERIKYRKNGVPFSSLKDYHLINAYEAPNIKVELIEAGDTEGPYNAKSIGEACHVPVTAAIVGAVNNALDSDMNSIPLSPDVICEYLAKRGEKNEA